MPDNPIETTGGFTPEHVVGSKGIPAATFMFCLARSHGVNMREAKRIFDLQQREGIIVAVQSDVIDTCEEDLAD
ncbi:MAG: hypothetical protein WCO33_03315 [bacterium]